MALGEERFIWEVPALSVSPVESVKFKLLLTVTVELPRLIVRVLLLFDDSVEVVTEKLLVVKVPWVTRTTVVVVNAPPKVTVTPAPFISKASSVFPAVVTVPVPATVRVPIYATVIPATNVTLPETVSAALPASVPVNPVQLIDFAPVLPAAIVTTPEDALEKKTSSADVGTDCPPAPPLVKDHLVPAVPSQEAVPPTQ